MKRPVPLVGLFAGFVHEVVCTVDHDVNNGTIIGTLAVIGIIAIFALVVVITMCGGCTPMEVGSDTYAADGSSQRMNDVQSNSVGNINTKVMTSGTTLLNNQCNSRNQTLLYPIPLQTSSEFTGYQSQIPQQGAVYGTNIGYQQSGYQSGGLHHQPGGTQHHVMVSGSARQTTEPPPPPNYYEAVQDSKQPSAPPPENWSGGQQANAPGNQYGL